MKINVYFVKWHTVVICVSIWLTVLVWKNVNGHKIFKQTPNLSVGLTDSTLNLFKNRNPSASLKYDSNMAENSSEEKSNVVVRSRHDGLRVNKTKNNQTQNKFNFIRKHSRLKKSVTEKENIDHDVKPKISTFKHTNLTDVDLAHYRELYFKLSMKKQMEFDAQRAYFCMFFIILVICFASWYTGICRIRNHSAMDVLDFESSQPLTTVKDVMLRKSRYLPMFENFYNMKKKVSRGTNP